MAHQVRVRHQAAHGRDRCWLHAVRMLLHFQRQPHNLNSHWGALPLAWTQHTHVRLIVWLHPGISTRQDLGDATAVLLASSFSNKIGV